MNYEQALSYIDNLSFMGKKAGLENITYLLKLLGNPHKNLKFVHIAGTNGKGSTTAMTANVLHCAGYCTGMFISPYIINFRERIQCNGGMISENELTDIVNIIAPKIEQMRGEGLYPTHFEVITAIGMYYFNQKKCDIVVLEVGLGGRLDSTNVIDPPLVAAITSIGLDHVHILGDTHRKIAYEKCGIFKTGSVAVSYPDQNQEAMETIVEEAKNKGMKLVVPQKGEAEIIKTAIEGTEIIYGGDKIQIPFMGLHQVYNFLTAATILQELRKMGYEISAEAFSCGIATTKFPARLEILHRAPLVIVDGAHNQSGAEALANAMNLIDHGKIHVIMGMLADKDYHCAVAQIACKADCFTAVTPDSYRALPAKDLMEVASEYCSNCCAVDSVTQAYENTLKECREEDTVLICGSLYLASEIRKYILEK